MPNAVQKTMLILRALSDGQGCPITVSTISAKTGINYSTVSHILKTLCADNYVIRVSHNEGYLLGPELHYLTRYGNYGKSLVDVCHPILHWLNKNSGGTALLAVLSGKQKYVIDRVENESIYKDFESNIIIDGLARTATGRVILAHMQICDALEIFSELELPMMGWSEVTDRDSFLKQLSEIRQKKLYHHCFNQSDAHWDSWAIPVMAKHKCIGAVGLAMKRRLGDPMLTQEEFARIDSLMEKSYREISRRMQLSLD